MKDEATKYKIILKYFTLSKLSVFRGVWIAHLTDLGPGSWDQALTQALLSAGVCLRVAPPPSAPFPASK